MGRRISETMDYGDRVAVVRVGVLVLKDFLGIGVRFGVQATRGVSLELSSRLPTVHNLGARVH